MVFDAMAINYWLACWEENTGGKRGIEGDFNGDFGTQDLNVCAWMDGWMDDQAERCTKFWLRGRGFDWKRSKNIGKQKGQFAG